MNRFPIGDVTLASNNADNLPAGVATIDTGTGSLRGTPEYEVAFNIEAWKRKEQAAFRAKLAESQRLAIKHLESQFNSRENERIAELESVRAELETMAIRVQKATKQADERTIALNDRERRLEDGCG